MDIDRLDPTTLALRCLSTIGINSYKERRREQLLNALAQGKIKIDSYELQSDEFISAYLATEDAIMKASSKSKFDMLIGLFLNGCNTGRISREPDSYQEALSIIGKLSEREIIILYNLYQYEVNHSDNHGPASDHQLDYLMQQTNLERNLVIALLLRLRSTGLLISHGEKNPLRDLGLTGVEAMSTSPIAKEIEDWVHFVIESPFIDTVPLR
ncbi:hypothetical protein GWC92_13150 [Aeromonas caviae]|uniref:hypothetical protein n=1 Tax=Aeromonas caviae TaxID=648 RepID=UPI0015DFD09C|nr:hypothetical protein [Aeromonas caviae]QLL81179.1 hypothetical protein GWC92_13150 [Aeromonas caviae]